MNVKFVSVSLKDVAEYYAKDFYDTADENNKLKLNRFYIDGSKMVFVLEDQKEEKAL